MKKHLKKYLAKIHQGISFLSSLKLAVINLVMLAVLSAIGTFLESYYDQELARAYIYHSIWMRLALISLFINISAVLVDRWPWKKHHISFITAHFGILMLIIGSWITQVKGVDGSMRLIPQEDTRYILLSEKILTVHSSFNGETVSELYRDQPQFLLRKPSVKKPYLIPLGKDQLRIVEHYPYAVSNVVFEANEESGMVFQFQLAGKQASLFDWVYLKKGRPITQKQVGLASIVVNHQFTFSEEANNELVLKPKNKNTVLYLLKSKGQFQKAGELKKGQSLQTGWMDLTFRLVDFYKADQVYQFTPKKNPSELTTSAINIQFKHKDQWQDRWDAVKFFYLFLF